jgi:hypothetical protein
MKKNYQHPDCEVVAIVQKCQLLAGSEPSTSGRPSATFMDDPGFGDEEDDDY